MSLKTDNFKLYKYEDNDIGDLRFINDSMDLIDKGINPFYVATQSSTNVYKVTTGLNKTVLNDGYSIKVAIPSNSTGAVSIIVDSVTVPIKKPNGNAVTNFKANGVYSLTYYNSVFILASGGGTDTVNFTSDKLLIGYSANDSNSEKVDGTMPNIGQQTATINAGGKTMISKGYHDGTGYVQANSLATQMANNGVTLADASQLIAGIKAISKTGQLLTGTADIISLGGLQCETGTFSYTRGNLITVPIKNNPPYDCYQILYVRHNTDHAYSFCTPLVENTYTSGKIVYGLGKAVNIGTYFPSQNNLKTYSDSPTGTYTYWLIYLTKI